MSLWEKLLRRETVLASLILEIRYASSRDVWLGRWSDEWHMVEGDVEEKKLGLNGRADEG
jgi:hypothetical protein